MSLQIAIVGLPNVGKSTLFNAMTKSQGAQVGNYPFCTIDPNVGVVEIKDERLLELARVSQSQKVVPAVIEFVDVAGLVKGASEGEGLGNKFLSHIRNCDAICEVVRIFEDDDIQHVDGSVNPERDVEVINSELILADLSTLERKINENQKKGQTGDKEAKLVAETAQKLSTHLNAGNLALTLELNDDEAIVAKEFHLLTMKPMLFVANLKEHELGKYPTEVLHQKLKLPESVPILPVSAKLEEELNELAPEEAKAYLAELGVTNSGLDTMIKTAFTLLSLQYYFTSGEKESKAWTIKQGTKAPQAAGVIHTDFEKGFIKADIVNWRDYVECGGWGAAREKGKVRLEGKDYVMRDGDVVVFKFNN